MPHRLRTAIAAALTLAVATTLTLTAGVGAATAASPRVVIIVGPTGALTDSYRTTGNQIATTAAAAGATVTKVYSPNATWAKVKAAVNGANIIVYLGHGNGYPSPYSSTQNTDRVNGWGLNRTTTNGDSDSWSSTMVYCGEKALLGTLTSSDGAAQWNYCGGKTNTDGISPAPGFVMIYNKACYAPGAGESGDTKATEAVARERVRNFSRPVLKLGAGAYFATDISASSLVDLILRNPNMSYADVARNGAGYVESAQRQFDHPDVNGARLWIQRTTSPYLGTDYWYAYAGNPSASFNNPAGIASRLQVSRHAGADRYATAAAASRASFDPEVKVAYVATGANFPDALAGSVAAAVKGGPILLVNSGIPGPTRQELLRLKPEQIVVLGGTGAVSNATKQELEQYATTNVVRRLAGSNRYATAAAISADTFRTPGVPVAYVATGANFPDALAGTPPAGSEGGPVLLATKTTLPDATAAELERLQPGRIVILGATGVISSAVAEALEAFTSGGVTRLAGADRYVTAATVSKASFGKSTTVYVATGANFPDALAGGPLAGRDGVPLLLVPGSTLPSAVRAEMLRLDPTNLVVLGSTGVVSDGVVNQLRALFPE